MPKFMSFLHPSNRDAEYEVQALLDHLLYHANTAPFIATRLIQRLTTSNPSPRYVASVASSFINGTYGGVTYGGGTYADLGATVAAVLLDREARSLAADADPTVGGLREPLLKVLHLMRAMEYTSKGAEEVELDSLHESMGMQAYRSPSVFSFFLPDYEPLGAVADAGLVSPESMLATGPLILGALNVMTALVHKGLSNCGYGAGSDERGSRCAGDNDDLRRDADGTLSFRPSGTSPKEIVDELDLLLTGGRMNTRNRRVIARRYRAVLKKSGSADEALRAVQELFLLAPEFHSTNDNAIRPTAARGDEASAASGGRAYKAVVYLFLQGGCDSYNVLVPYDGCHASVGDLYESYKSVRGVVALDKELLAPINGSGQVCERFGVHTSLPTLISEYKEGNAAFIANVGPLVMPTSMDAFHKKTVRTPPGLFAHNVQQKVVQNMHPQETSRAKGVLGRMLASLADRKPGGYKTQAYSAAGNAKVLEGGPRPQIIPSDGGMMEFSRYAELRLELSNLTSFESSSIFAETQAALVQESLADSERLKSALSTSTGSSYPRGLGSQMMQIAKVIAARAKGELTEERSTFFASQGAFDTHNGPLSEARLGQVEGALAPFVADMKTLGIWENVTVVIASEFGRTITSNGKGTDHGWGGHAMLMGGAVRGGRIFGRYPNSLGTDHQLNAGRGRIIPTTSWEAVWHAIAQWFGVDEADMQRILPNVRNFEKCAAEEEGCGLFTAEDLFTAV